MKTRSLFLRGGITASLLAASAAAQPFRQPVDLDRNGIIDTAEISAAVSAAAADGGGVVYLRAGQTYRLDATLVVAADHITISGETPGGRLPDGSTYGVVLELAPGLAGNAIRVERCADSGLASLTVLGHDEANTAPAVCFEGVAGARIENVRLAHLDDALELVGGERANLQSLLIEDAGGDFGLRVRGTAADPNTGTRISHFFALNSAATVDALVVGNHVDGLDLQDSRMLDGRCGLHFTGGERAPRRVSVNQLLVRDSRVHGVALDAGEDVSMANVFVLGAETAPLMTGSAFIVGAAYGRGLLLGNIYVRDGGLHGIELDGGEDIQISNGMAGENGTNDPAGTAAALWIETAARHVRVIGGKFGELVDDSANDAQRYAVFYRGTGAEAVAHGVEIVAADTTGPAGGVVPQALRWIAPAAAAAAPGPTITTPPQSRTARAGDTVSFTVVATGAPLAYQWYFNHDAIAGATGPAFTLAGATALDAGRYFAVVSNAADRTISAEATLMITAAGPTAPVAATPTGIAHHGFTANWSSVAGATGYRLDVSTSNAFGTFVTGWENSDAGGSLSCQVTGLNPGTTYYYRVRATNSAGASVSSAVMAVTTASAIAPQITSPAGTPFTTGLAGTFTVRATGSPAPAFAAGNLPGWAALDPVSGLLRGTPPAEAGGGQVILSITADNGTPPAATQSFTLTVQPPPVIAAPLTITTLAGRAGASGSADAAGSGARFNAPLGVAADGDGNIYIADTDNHAVRKVTSDGVVTTVAGRPGIAGHADGAGGAATWDAPSGLALDRTGNLYVADTLNHTIRKISPAGTVSTLAGQAGVPGRADGTGTQARFHGPQGVAVDPVDGGRIHVADTGNHTIRTIALATGAVTTVAGEPGVAGSVDAIGGAARFDSPSGIAVGAGGALYVADSGNNQIRKITADARVTTLAGLAGSTGAADGTGPAARFNQPVALAADGAGGSLYVLDADNHTVRQVGTADGAVTTLAGLAGTAGAADGAGEAARFRFPAGLAWSPTGLAIADTSNHTLRQGRFAAAPAITVQPQSRTVTAGTGVTFAVAATAQPAPHYQWYFGDDAIPGATSTDYSIASAESANAGSYTVVVSNVLGRVTSAAAMLTVDAAPSSGGAGPSSGGGGAPSGWFLLALLLIGLGRVLWRRPAPGR